MKKKVLILQETLSLYNVPIFKLLSEKYNLTIAYTEKNEGDIKMSFAVKKLEYRKIGPFKVLKNQFFKLCSNYDVVIFLCDLHYLSFCILPFIGRKYKVIPWTIGIRASYKKRYDINRALDFYDKLYLKILNKADAIIFYMPEPLKFWGNNIDSKKVFIARNTVEVLPNNFNEKKNRVLFLGTLYKEKKIYELIDAFLVARKESKKLFELSLHIIGKGPEYQYIDEFINKNRLSNSIYLYGAIYDENILADHFSKSLVCISPDQAGLSVLKSLGYGVPFVTRFDAITGGEKFNIIDQYNGMFYRSFEELVNILLDVNENDHKYIEMGKNAKEFYFNECSPEHMASGFFDAIDFVSV